MRTGGVDDTSGSSLLSVSSQEVRRDADHDEGGAPRLLMVCCVELTSQLWGVAGKQAERSSVGMRRNQGYLTSFLGAKLHSQPSLSWPSCLAYASLQCVWHKE